MHNKEQELYRDAARRLFPNVRIGNTANVHPVFEDGAFVEAVVWIDKSEILAVEVLPIASEK